MKAIYSTLEGMLTFGYAIFLVPPGCKAEAGGIVPAESLVVVEGEPVSLIEAYPTYSLMPWILVREATPREIEQYSGTWKAEWYGAKPTVYRAEIRDCDRVAWGNLARVAPGSEPLPGEEEMKTKPEKSEQMEQRKERAVIVTTVHKGVFFGYAAETSGATIKLRAARLCVYWTSDLRGFMGLAAQGPGDGCKIGPSADIELRDITSVVEVTAEAAKKWELAPW